MLMPIRRIIRRVCFLSNALKGIARMTEIIIHLKDGAVHALSRTDPEVFRGPGVNRAVKLKKATFDNIDCDWI